MTTCIVATQDQRPRFQSTVDVTTVDCTVVNSDGKPVLNLKPTDFSVRVDGSPRRVERADWVPLAVPRANRPRVPEGYTTNEQAGDGRLILIVIDQPNIRSGGAFFARDALDRFIDHLQSSDSVGLVGLGPGAPAVSFTTEHDRIRRAMAMMVGQRDVMPVDMMSELRKLLNGLIAVEGPIVLVSEGIVIPDEQRATVPELGRLAAAARTTIYALRLDQRVGDADQKSLTGDPTLSDSAAPSGSSPLTSPRFE